MAPVTTVLLTPLLMVALAITWVGAFVFAIRVCRHAQRLDASPWYIKWAPMNLLVRPDLWTPESRRDCVAFFISGAAFLAAGIALEIIGAALG